MSHRISMSLVLVLSLLGIPSCRSPHVEVSVLNRTGAEVHLLEVDYPSASFGADSLANGATLRYRIQVQGNGQVKVQYTAPDRTQPQAVGPALHNLQAGRLEIVLLPDGKAEFRPETTED